MIAFTEPSDLIAELEDVQATLDASTASDPNAPLRDRVAATVARDIATVHQAADFGSRMLDYGSSLLDYGDELRAVQRWLDDHTDTDERAPILDRLAADYEEQLRSSDALLYDRVDVKQALDIANAEIGGVWEEVPDDITGADTPADAVRKLRQQRDEASEALVAARLAVPDDVNGHSLADRVTVLAQQRDEALGTIGKLRSSAGYPGDGMTATEALRLVAQYAESMQYSGEITGYIDGLIAGLGDDQ